MVPILSVLCTHESYSAFSKQLLWPICYDTLSLLLNSILANSNQVTDRKQVCVLVNAANSINEAVWECFQFKKLFSSLSDQISNKENASIELYSDLINLLGDVLFHITAKETKHCYADIMETKFLLQLKAYLTMNSSISISDFQATLLAFQFHSSESFFNVLKKYAKITHLLATKRKDLELSAQLFNAIMKVFAEFYHGNEVLVGDFAYTLSKLSSYLPQTEGAVAFISSLLNSENECCHISMSNSKLLYAFLKSIKRVTFFACTKLNPNCASCEAFLIDLYTYQAHNSGSPDISSVLVHLQRSFSSSATVLHDAAVCLFEAVQGTCQSVSLRALLPSFGCGETESPPEVRALIENANILEQITIELERIGGSVGTILRGYFQVLDLKLLLLRSLIGSEDYKWTEFLGPKFVAVHKSVSETALKLFCVLHGFFKSLFGETSEDHSFRSFYNISIGNSKFVARVEPTVKKLPLSTVRSLHWYGSEAVHMLQYLGYHRESQLLLQHLIALQFYLKAASKGSRSKEVYSAVVLRYLTLLHELLESYCSHGKDRKDKADCLNYLQKCNERYKDNITTLLSNNDSSTLVTRHNS